VRYCFDDTPPARSLTQTQLSSMQQASSSDSILIETKTRRNVSFADGDVNEVFEIPRDLHRSHRCEPCPVWNEGDQGLKYVSKPTVLGRLMFGQRTAVDNSRVRPLTHRPPKLVKMKKACSEFIFEEAAVVHDIEEPVKKEEGEKIRDCSSCLDSEAVNPAFGSGYKIDAKGRQIRFSRRLANKA